MSKSIGNQYIANCLIQGISPYSQNVILNASRDIQEKVVEKIESRCSSYDSLLGETFGVLHLDGSEIMKETSAIRASIEEYCVKKGFDYDDIEREYRELQATDINKLSVDKLKEFQKRLLEMEKRRNIGQRSRIIASMIYRGYLGSKLYQQLLSRHSDAISELGKDRLPTEEKHKKIIRMYEAIINGDMEEYASNNGFDLHNLQNICAEIFKSQREGFLTLIRNGESVVDHDLHAVINNAIASRSASLSISIMTRSCQLYSYYVNDDFSLQETHDIRTQNVGLIKKYSLNKSNQSI